MSFISGITVENTVSTEQVVVAAQPTSDAFSRSRVSLPRALFENHSVYGKESLLWEELTAGSGSVTFNAGDSKILLNVGTGDTDRAVRQSKSYAIYEPGRSQLVLLTGILGPSKLYVVSRMGYFDDKNGLFFQMSGPTIDPVALASDNFPGSSLSGNWTTEVAGGGSISVNSGAAWSTGPQNTHGIAEYTGISWPNDQYSEITYGALGSIYETDIIGPAVRMNHPSWGGYWSVFYGDQWYLWAVNPDGTLHHQIAITGGGINPGDKIRLSVNGIKLLLTQNGVPVIQAVDVTWGSGNAGIQGYNQSANPTQAQAQTISHWEAGSSGEPGGLQVVLRNTEGSSTLDTVFPQSMWNMDKLDGTGPSGTTIDPTLNQVHIIDLQWLGAGRVRFGFNFGSGPIYCHQIVNHNAITGVDIQSACLPVRYEIENIGIPGSGSTLTQICSVVFSEGESSRKELAFQFSTNNGASVKAVTSAKPIISIQPTTTFGGFRNCIKNLLTEVTISTSAATILYQLVYNGTLGSPSFNNVDATNSGMTYDVSATSISGGVVVDSAYVTTNGAEFDYSDRDWVYKLPFTLNLAGDTGDIFTIVATSLGGSTNVAASISWQEQR